MKVLVCGGRNFSDYQAVDAVLCALPVEPSLIIHGGARGADRLAKQWAIANGIHHCAVPALWDYYQRSAGMLRNKAMMLLQPDYGVAFPGGSGTAGMVRLLIEAGVPVWQPFP